MRQAMLVELSDLFRREAEHVTTQAWQHRGHVSQDAEDEADRLHSIADELWERAELGAGALR